MHIKKNETSFKGTYFFNKTQKRDFIKVKRENGLALSLLRNYLKQYQQKANVRLSFVDDILTLSTTGKANRYAHNSDKLTSSVIIEAKDVSMLLIEKSSGILEKSGLLWKPAQPYKSQSKRLEKCIF